MPWFSYGVSTVAALAIVVIGAMYLLNPRSTSASFGLPLPEQGSNVSWWLRLKGVRDVVSGLVLLAVMALGDTRIWGIVLLIEALIPLCDMSLILIARGSVTRALGIHGLTAALMAAAALPLVI